MSETVHTVRYEPHHYMLTPEPGKDHGPAMCGAPKGSVVIFPKNVTCRACVAMLEVLPLDGRESREAGA